MPPDLNALRHSQLFDLLHQETQSEQTSTRLRARGFARQEQDREEAARIRAQALASWR